MSFFWSKPAAPPPPTEPKVSPAPPEPQLPSAPLPPSLAVPPTQKEVIEPIDSATAAARSRKQLTVFLAGTAFFGLSILTTRRVIARKQAVIAPVLNAKGKRVSPAPEKANGPFEAAHALGIATLNVMAFTLMATGGALWWFDISNMNDLRRKVRKGMGIEGVSEMEQEEEMEEWLATVIARKEEKEKKRKSTGIDVKEH